jgi:predicted porin
MKKVLKVGLPIGLVALSAASFNATADVRINGFASFVAGQTLSEDETYLGYSNDLSFSNESIFALQVTADLGDGLSATAQIVSEGADKFNTKFAWAYMSYEMTDYTTVRAGRLRLPFYLYSDYLDVGYAYPWVRPSNAMYNLPFSNYDGVSVLHNKLLGDWDFTFNFLAGELKDIFFTESSPTEGDLTDVLGLATTFSYNYFSGYVTYIITEATIPVQDIESFADLSQALGASEATANLLRINEDKGWFFGAGFNVDYDKWSVIAEYSQYKVEDSILDEADEASYVSIGYRVKEGIMPYVLFESFETAESDIYKSFPSTIIPPLGTSYDGFPLNLATKALLDGINRNEYTTTSFGVRYDFHPSAVFKVQYSMVDNKLDDNYSADALAIAVDIVF